MGFLNRHRLNSYGIETENVFKENISIQNPISNKNKDNELAIKNPIKFINKYLNNTIIDNAIRINPNIKTILKDNKLNITYKLENVSEISLSHLVPVLKKSQEIYKKMGHNENEKNWTYLSQASLLHDIGKIFIPSDILNKKGFLTLAERRIIELHNRLSYEILITTELDKNVAKLAYEHHDYNQNIKKTQENQALAIADVYCALKEKRPYKKPMSEIRTRMILYDMATKGKLDTRYINYIN